MRSSPVTDPSSVENVYTDVTGDSGDVMKEKPQMDDASADSTQHAGDFTVFPADSKS